MNEDDSSKTRRVEAMLRTAFGDKPGYWGCKDAASIFIYANEEYGNIIGLKHHLDVIDRSDFDMPCDTVVCAQAFRDQDKEVMASGQTLRILDIHPFAGGEWKAYLTTKRPLHGETEGVIGTIFHGEDITSPCTIELGSLLGRIYTGDQLYDSTNEGSYWLGERSKMPIHLTTRESEILFFLIRGYSIKSIAEIFHVSMRTVEDHVGSLRHKFVCTNKASLIEHAIYLGYLHYIPKMLFNRQLSLILRGG